MAAEGAEQAKHDRENETAAATDNEWKKDSKEGATGTGRVRFGEADAFGYDAPNTRNQAPAHRHDHQRVGRAGGEANNAKSGFKRTLSSSHKH